MIPFPHRETEAEIHYGKKSCRKGIKKNIIDLSCLLSLSLKRRGNVKTDEGGHTDEESARKAKL